VKTSNRTRLPVLSLYFDVTVYLRPNRYTRFIVFSIII